MADLNPVDSFASFAVSDLDAAQKFYSETLGLPVTMEEMGILSVKAPGGTVMIYPKDDHAPANFTVFNLVVQSVETTVDALANQGVKFEIYDGDIKTDARGIADDGRGPKIAWFKDPSGNVLSIIEAS